MKGLAWLSFALGVLSILLGVLGKLMHTRLLGVKHSSWAIVAIYFTVAAIALLLFERFKS